MKNIFKKSVLLLTLIMAQAIICRSILAQVPQKFSYQAIVRNSSNELVKNTTIGVEIEIGIYFMSGFLPKLIFKEYYTETHTVTTRENGMFTLSIGRGTKTYGKFDTIP